eukprot:scaffold1536_cov397-Prasinococcus_capsulatus_cf.AAC.8
MDHTTSLAWDMGKPRATAHIQSMTTIIDGSRWRGALYVAMLVPTSPSPAAEPGAHHLPGELEPVLRATCSRNSVN